ncbi:MAG: globin [Pseudomonadales bacterium]|nr:globin [Pseudomonadales bacterium]
MSANRYFDASYERLFGEGVGIDQRADQFFSKFYTHFLADPEVAELFSGTDMAHQAGMLRSSFFHLVAFYASHKPSAELDRIARLHDRLGILHVLYDTWLDALIQTVREEDADCDELTEMAWRLAMTPGLTYMRLVGHLGAGHSRTQD